MGAQIALALPAKLRPVLRKPFGVLYKGTGKDTIQKIAPDLGSPTKLISVGDVTTFYLLESDIIPDVCVVDDRTKREPASNHVVLGTNHKAFTTISVDNPPGVITEDLINAIDDALRSDQHVRLFVRGEEDLAALPAILMAPIGSVVLYGQPNEGVVLVKITESKKDEIRSLLDQIIDEYDEGQFDSVRRKLDGY
ncbi:MAG: GTP-dependent dephospho-CoA kinase family protein [Methanosarcinaceae archaeon]|nr:GTP-dependent dephospho-CoA kinase family protein [Methanosarcinaceae archaeon]